MDCITLFQTQDTQGCMESRRLPDKEGVIAVVENTMGNARIDTNTYEMESVFLAQGRKVLVWVDIPYIIFVSEWK